MIVVGVRGKKRIGLRFFEPPVKKQAVFCYIVIVWFNFYDMKKRVMKKETFCKILHALDKSITTAETIENGVNDVLGKTTRFNGDEKTNLYSFLHNNELEDEIVRALKMEFELPDRMNTLEYFIYELDFGRNYTDGCLTDDNGCDVRISTAEELYDVLVKDL